MYSLFVWLACLLLCIVDSSSPPFSRTIAISHRLSLSPPFSVSKHNVSSVPINFCVSIAGLSRGIRYITFFLFPLRADNLKHDYSITEIESAVAFRRALHRIAYVQTNSWSVIKHEARSQSARNTLNKQTSLFDVSLTHIIHSNTEAHYYWQSPIALLHLPLNVLVEVNCVPDPG